MAWEDSQTRIHTAGVWNAVAFWFDLQLDEETSLSTSPYSAKVTVMRPCCVAALSRKNLTT